MSGALFGNKIEPACKYCELSMQVLEPSGDVLCEKRGIVSANYHCRKYIYDPLKRIPRRPLVVQKYTAEDFSLV